MAGATSDRCRNSPCFYVSSVWVWSLNFFFFFVFCFLLFFFCFAVLFSLASHSTEPKSLFGFQLSQKVVCGVDLRAVSSTSFCLFSVVARLVSKVDVVVMLLLSCVSQVSMVITWPPWSHEDPRTNDETTPDWSLPKLKREKIRFCW